MSINRRQPAYYYLDGAPEPALMFEGSVAIGYPLGSGLFVEARGSLEVVPGAGRVSPWLLPLLTLGVGFELVLLR